MKRKDKSITDINDDLWNRAKKKFQNRGLFMGAVRQNTEEFLQDVVNGKIKIQIKRNGKEAL